MKSCAWLLWALLAVTWACAEDAAAAGRSFRQRTVSLVKRELGGLVPEGSALPASRRVRRSSSCSCPSTTSLFGDSVNLQWVTFQGSLPNDAVYIDRDNVEHYVCQADCVAGVHRPWAGPYCHYPDGLREHRSSSFQILVNKDNFEVLEWKAGAGGSVPPHAVQVCPGVKTYVGRNKWGLGKVVPRLGALYLPRDGREDKYSGEYQVLAVNRDAYRQHISDVRYALDRATVSESPTVTFSNFTNSQCQPATKKLEFYTTAQVEHTWSIGRPTRLGTAESISARIPLPGSGGMQLTPTPQTLALSEGGTHLGEAVKEGLELRLSVAPRHACTVRVEGRKIATAVPFDAYLSRTYADGNVRSTSTGGTYRQVRVGKVHAVLEGCWPLPDAQPCPRGSARVPPEAPALSAAVGSVTF